MDLTLQDKNELLKAAAKSTDKAISIWLVSIVDAYDALPDGKRNVTIPPYKAPHPVQRWEAMKW
jgi:hypothetical protein